MELKSSVVKKIIGNVPYVSDTIKSLSKINFNELKIAEGGLQRSPNNDCFVVKQSGVKGIIEPIVNKTEDAFLKAQADLKLHLESLIHEDGKLLYYEKGNKKILDAADTVDKINAAKQLTSIRYQDNSPYFDYDDLNSLCNIVKLVKSPEYGELANQLANERHGPTSLCFWHFDIENILERVKDKEHASFVTSICKKSDNAYDVHDNVFDSLNIEQEQVPLMQKMLNLAYPDGEPVFWMTQLLKDSEDIRIPKQVKFAEYLSKITNKEGKPLFSPENILEYIDMSPPRNSWIKTPKLYPRIALMEDSIVGLDKKPLFSIETKADLIDSIEDEDQIDYGNWLAKLKRKDGKALLNEYQVAAFMKRSSTSEAIYYKKQAIKPFLEQEILDEKSAPMILLSINNDNAELAKIMCTDCIIPTDKISKILGNTDKKNLNSKIDMYNLLKNVSDIQKDQFIDAIYYTNDDNFALGKLLYNDAKFPKNNIPKILTSTNKNNSDSIARNYKKYPEVLQEAYAKKNQLKSGLEDISDAYITATFDNNYGNVNIALDVLGKSTFIHSYPSKLTGVIDLAKKCSEVKEKMSPNNYELLLQKFNPESSQKYLSLKDEIIKLKESLNNIKGANLRVEELSASKKLAKIELKFKVNKAIVKQNPENIELARKISANNKKLIHKANELKRKLFETKKLHPEYSKIEKLEKEISIKNKELKAVSVGVDLDPQSKIHKLKALSAIAGGDDDAQFIKLIKSKTPENEKAWNDAINRKIFDNIGVEYNEQLSQRLNLSENKYLAEILSGNSNFKRNFKDLVILIQKNPNKPINEILNDLPQNKQTKEMFKQIGVDYDKWVNVDKNSFIPVEVRTSVDSAKQAAIEGLEAEFNDHAFHALPKEETNKLINVLKENGIELKEIEETNYDENGIEYGRNKVLRFYSQNKPIEFSQVEKVISLIKKEINSNDFWSKKLADSQMNAYRETMYSHLVKDRDIQIKNAAALKMDEIVELEIRKTDMNNIQHALFLGNHGSCCTAVGTGGNQFSAPTYIKNKMTSAIEVVDGKDFVGNTMCYIAEVDGKPSLVLDNIELNAKYQKNDKIREAMFEYARKMTAEIGQPDMPIYAGPYRHKLNMEHLPKEEHEMKVIGSTGKDEIYFDFLTSGRVVDGSQIDEVTLYKIK